MMPYIHILIRIHVNFPLLIGHKAKNKMITIYQNFLGIMIAIQGEKKVCTKLFLLNKINSQNTMCTTHGQNFPFQIHFKFSIKEILPRPCQSLIKTSEKKIPRDSFVFCTCSKPQKNAIPKSVKSIYCKNLVVRKSLNPSRNSIRTSMYRNY